MLDKETIKQIALDNGFKLKEQPDGSLDLNPYVYIAINKAIEAHESKKNNGWISVDKELPDPEQEINFLDNQFDPTKFYLIQLHNGFIDTAYYATICDDCEYKDIFVSCTVSAKDGRYRVQERGFDIYDTNEVKFWQPMPEPAKD